MRDEWHALILHLVVLLTRQGAITSLAASGTKIQEKNRDNK
jgi:hypothetical protein